MKDDEIFSQVYLALARSITWKIPDFCQLPETTTYSLDSPVFSFANSTWCLRIYPYAKKSEDSDSETDDNDSDGVENENNWYRNEDIDLADGVRDASGKNRKDESSESESDEEEDDEQQFIGFTIVRLTYRAPHQRLRYNVMLQGEDFGMHALVSDFDNEDEYEKGKMNLIERWYVLNRSSSFLRKGTLTLICQIFSEGAPPVEVSSQTEEVFKQDTNGLGTLSRNFKHLLLNGQDHDVTLRVKDKEFRAHRAILRARSPVLESALSHDMIEKNSGIVDIPDCDPGAFQQFLIYLYSGEADTLDTSNMLSLYYAADKYDTGCLKEKCRQFIKRSLSPSNVSDVVQLALDHTDADLLEWATVYFVKEVGEILPTVEWQSFVKQNPIQANELFIKATKNFNNLISGYQKTNKILLKNATRQQ